ncbi:MAG: ABC transporter ATP-binding protein [Thermoflexaceae bacterium]|nr:ABC transporter ATP-binding protein [Thermoflexaceae bacterium]
MIRNPKEDHAEEKFIESFKKYKDNPLKILLSIYKGNYSKFLLSVIFFVIKHSPVWMAPIVLANIINYVTLNDEHCMKKVILNVGLMIFLILLNVPMNYFHVKFKSLAVRYVETGLRGALVKKLQQLSISYHKNMQSGRLQSKIMRDVEAVETLSTQMFVSLLNIALNIVIAMIVTVSKSIIVFAFFVLTVPVAAITMVTFKGVIRKRNQEFRKEMESTSARVMEMVELIPVTRAHALEEEEAQKVSEHLIEVAEKGYRLDIIQSTFGSVGWAVFQVFQIICLAFTAYLAFGGKILVGDIALYQNYFSTIVQQVSAIITLIPTITKGLESVRSIGEVLVAEDVEENEGKEVVDSVEGEFVFKNVEFRYNKESNPILKGLNLTVKKGETIALVGESGAGKTTILNLVVGFNLADKGEVLLDGKSMKDIDLRSYRKHLAVVPQNTILFSGTIRDNITYGIHDVDEDTLMEVVKAANLMDLVESLPDGLNTVVGEHGGRLSGGQRQRIAIARALIRNPQVIVLDEATSALDSISEKLIQEAINNLTANRTTFIVAHRLSTIKDADKIAVIRDGRCAEYGTYEELMELKGEFYRMKQIQS